jgi:hypothetical protein
MVHGLAELTMVYRLWSMDFFCSVRYFVTGKANTAPNPGACIYAIFVITFIYNPLPLQLWRLPLPRGNPGKRLASGFSFYFLSSRHV